MDDEKVERKPIVGYEGLYEIYADGRIYGVKSRKFLKFVVNKDTGYSQVYLCKNALYETYRVHSLVAQHFIPNDDNKPCVDYKDMCKTNNHMNNLRWATVSENHMNIKAQSNNRSGVKNVSLCSRSKKWRVIFQVNGKQVCFGYYVDLEQALSVASKVRKKLHGEFHIHC